ncbi:MAG: hypothetical protein KC619_30985 [Myxococcales bacterium]|nr:hypothetical protein [Myxococcales bacterium]
MRETAIAFAILVALGGFAWLLTLPAEVVMLGGQAVMLTSGGVGIPLEVIYFALLGGVLFRRSVLPRGWYWRTFEHHHLLAPRERWLVLPFFYAGALAFVVCTLGIVVTAAGLAATLLSL